MSRKSRSVIDANRMKQLLAPDTVYNITCHGQEYFCASHSEGCWRGFFSLYIQAVYGIHFANRLRIPYYVNFGNLRYRYSDEREFNGDLNFWNYYFVQHPISETQTMVPNLRYENYPLRVWNREFIKQLNRSMRNDIILRSEVRDYIDSFKKQYQGLRILGIHIRRTDHFNDIEPAKDQDYFKAIDSCIEKFDKLFVATDDLDTLQLCIEKYKNKIVYQDAIRSSGITSIHYLKTDNMYLLGKQALLECYMLSSCEKVILSPSNLSYAVLLINPDIEFQMIESWAARKARWKTLIAFHLNRLNIRKW